MREKSTPCLLCGNPVTRAMWRVFTPCPKSKDGKSGHMLACSPDSIGRIKPKQSITPGPWRTGDMFNTVFGPKTGAPCPEVIATIHKGNRANAQAIAAVPELLAFVGLVARMQTEEEYGENAPESEDWISTLNDLIASARKLVK